MVQLKFCLSAFFSLSFQNSHAILAQASQVQMADEKNVNRPSFMVASTVTVKCYGQLGTSYPSTISSAPPALIYGVVVCDLAVRGGAKLKNLYTIALFAAKQHAAMPWGLKVIRKSGYASNFPLIRALCQNLHTISDAYFWSFCDNGLPTSWQHRHPTCKAIYPIGKF